MMGLMAATQAVNNSTNHHPTPASLRQRASSAPVFIATHKAPCAAIGDDRQFHIGQPDGIIFCAE
jgi:hypothetical protein